MLPGTQMTEPLRIAIVGHTNTGKTSLMRTLTRDTGFGEVSSRPSTTRHVEGARLMVDGEVLVELYDTPGLEDPIALLEQLETIAADGGERLDGIARIQRCLPMLSTGQRFEQEAKVLRQMLASTAAFYVVDARDPVLAKHRDELVILSACAIPLLPVLNFVRDPAANEPAWREALARLGLHAVVRFDTVAPERDGEQRLYEKLATVLDDFRPVLQRLVEGREREAQARHAAALRLVAEMLVDVAAGRVTVAMDPEREVGRAVDGLYQKVRKREQACVDTLLELYRFRPDDVDAARLPLLDGRWEDDLFNPETLRVMGVKLGSGAAAGAAAGVGIDLMFGGLTLGAAATLGAFAGGGWQAVQHYGGRVFDKLRGRRELTVDDVILQLLVMRQLSLIGALEARGHAAIIPIRQADLHGQHWRQGGIAGPLKKARAHPRWSRLFGDAHIDVERQEAVDSLVELLSGLAEA